MGLSPEAAEKMKTVGLNLAKSVGPLILMAALKQIISKLVVTNHKESNLTGETKMHPTDNKSSISQVETTAKDTDASLAKDEVKAKDGDLSAAKTDANASTTEATAAESGAAAARTKAGAADVETKALKMT